MPASTPGPESSARQLGVGADGLLEHQLLVGAPQQGGGVQAEGVAQQAEVEGDLLVDAVDGALGELELVDLAAAGGGPLCSARASISRKSRASWRMRWSSPSTRWLCS
jgi:hypothetical protein